MASDYYINNIYIYQYDGIDGLPKIQAIMKLFRYGFKTIGGLNVESVLDYSKGLDGLPTSDAVQYLLTGGSSVILKPSAIEPTLTVYISIKGDSEEIAAATEARVSEDLEGIIYMDDRMGYCCE